MSAATAHGRVPAPFPWRAALHAGLALLRIPPRDFWAMTPVELHAACGGLRPLSPPLSRTGLDALMQDFPDS